MSNTKKFIKGVSNLAETIFVSPATIRNWMSKGMPFFRVGLEIHFESELVGEWLIMINEEKYGHLAKKLLKQG